MLLYWLCSLTLGGSRLTFLAYSTAHVDADARASSLPTVLFAPTDGPDC